MFNINNNIIGNSIINNNINNDMHNNFNIIDNTKIHNNSNLNNNQNYIQNPINNMNEINFQNSNDNINKILNLKQDYNIINNLFPLSTMLNSNHNSKNLSSGNKFITSKNEQDKIDEIRKTEIIYRNSVELTKYYDYSEDQTENELNKLLGEISYFGDLAEEEIEKEIISNPNKYISIEETIQKGSSSSQYNSNSFSNPFFVLSILAKALMSQGCKVAIERDEPQNVKEKMETNPLSNF